jgi:hypothetical protein
MERYSAFGKAKYELTDDITAFVQGQYVSYDTKILVESGNTALGLGHQSVHPVKSGHDPGEPA